MRLVFPVTGLFMAASICCCCGDLFDMGGSSSDFGDFGADAAWGEVPEALKEFPEPDGAKLTVGSSIGELHSAVYEVSSGSAEDAVGSYRDYATSNGWTETVYVGDDESATYIAEKDGATLSVVASELGGQLNLTVSLDRS